METLYSFCSDASTIWVGNQVPRYSGWKRLCSSRRRFLHREVGNQVPRYSGWKRFKSAAILTFSLVVGNQVPRYSGWKPVSPSQPMMFPFVGNQVPRYSGWKLPTPNAPISPTQLETKYRDIADGNNNVKSVFSVHPNVGNQVPRYSGWKHSYEGTPSVLLACWKPSTAI